MLTLFFIALALSLDGFTIVASIALRYSAVTFSQSLQIALCFTFFQIVMPFIGWKFGKSIEGIVEGYSHGIAFSVLFLTGLRMLFEAFSMEQKKDRSFPPFFGVQQKQKNDKKQALFALPDNRKTDNVMNKKVLLLLGVTSSLDSLAVGIGFAVVSTPIFLPLVIIAIVTFFVTLSGSVFGAFLLRSPLVAKYAIAFGGIILFSLSFLHFL